MNKVIKSCMKFLLSLLLGAFTLYWVYHDFDFSSVNELLLSEIDWRWMAASLFFGILSHVLRGIRWRQALEPLNAFPKRANCVDAIFLSYATNLVLPRVGEVSRCGVLLKSDKVPFAQSLGTVVTERLLDTVCIGIITALTFFLEMPVCLSFFHETGTKIPSLLHLLQSPWFYVSFFCILGACWILYRLLKTFSVFDKVKGMASSIVDGMKSLKNVKNLPLFIIYTVGIWVCYILHFYLTFFCFDFTSHLTLDAAMVMFVGGTFAVIVPTPNGAGPWHFAVITMMMLYGITPQDASLFALVVHAIQTLLVVLLGIYGLIHQMVVSR